MDHSMYSLDKVLAPLPNATKAMLEMARQQEDPFAIPSGERGLAILGIGPTANSGASGMKGFRHESTGDFSAPISANRSSGVGLGTPINESEQALNPTATQEYAEQKLDPTAPPVNEPVEYDGNVDEELMQMFLALDDKTLRGAERMVKSFEQIFDQYAQRTGRNMQADLFSLQPGRQRETEYTTLNPGAY